MTYLAAVSIVVGAFAAAAFSASRIDSRAVTVNVVGDSAAYLAVYVNSASPHAGFVSEAADGRLQVDFGSGAATGTGMNPDAVYMWDDIIVITNQGTETVWVKVAAASDTGVLYVATKAASGQMVMADYVQETTPIELEVGETLYMGIYADSTGLNKDDTVSGSFTVYATRTDAGTL